MKVNKHGKGLGSTSVNARVNLRLRLSYILKMFYQTFSLHQNWYYLRLRLCEKGDSAIPAVDSGHLGDTEKCFLILGPP